mgnify:CR=1 FL=1
MAIICACVRALLQKLGPGAAKALGHEVLVFNKAGRLPFADHNDHALVVDPHAQGDGPLVERLQDDVARAVGGVAGARKAATAEGAGTAGPATVKMDVQFNSELLGKREAKAKAEADEIETLEATISEVQGELAEAVETAKDVASYEPDEDEKVTLGPDSKIDKNGRIDLAVQPGPNHRPA